MRCKLPSISPRIDSRFKLCVTSLFSFQEKLHFVNTYGRRDEPRFLSARPMTSSECPRPYVAAVSIQLIPEFTACSIVAIESLSSCGPQPKSQSPPPIAHAPKPIGVISRSEFPSFRFSIFLHH